MSKHKDDLSVTTEACVSLEDVCNHWDLEDIIEAYAGEGNIDMVIEALDEDRVFAWCIEQNRFKTHLDEQMRVLHSVSAINFRNDMAPDMWHTYRGDEYCGYIVKHEERFLCMYRRSDSRHSFESDSLVSAKRIMTGLIIADTVGVIDDHG